jgi:hypothetical protein
MAAAKESCARVLLCGQLKKSSGKEIMEKQQKTRARGTGASRNEQNGEQKSQPGALIKN